MKHLSTKFSVKSNFNQVLNSPLKASALILIHLWEKKSIPLRDDQSDMSFVCNDWISSSNSFYGQTCGSVEQYAPQWKSDLLVS